MVDELFGTLFENNILPHSRFNPEDKLSEFHIIARIAD